MKRTCNLLGMLSIVVLAACAKRYPAPDLTSGEWRTSVFAIAPVTNEAPDPEGATAGRAIREAIYAELIRRQDQPLRGALPRQDL